MKQMIKGGARILYNYVIALIVFVIFLYPFIAFTREKLYTYLPVYCVILFLFAFYLIYTDFKAIGKKEKKPQYGLNPYPMKGLVYGLIGIVPIAVIVLVALLVKFDNELVERIKHLAVNTLLGPMYFILRWFRESPVGYATAVLVLPLISMLGYLAGHYNIEVFNKVFKKKEPVHEKKFKKSPWNPSVMQSENTAKNTKKKKKVGIGSQRN